MSRTTDSRPRRSTSDRVRRVAQLVLATLLVIAVGTGLWRAHANTDRSLSAQVDAVTSGLRCPTCSGQSVADSESDLARQMRGVAAQQLAAGRSPDQVRTFFVQRYGSQVLLDPPLSGLGLAARLVPFALLILGGVIIGRRLGGRRGVAAGAAFSVGLAGVLLGTGVLSSRIGPSTAADHGAAAAPTAAPTPTSTASTVSTASAHSALVALQAGDARTAEREARDQLSSARKGTRPWQDALLVLGLAEHQQGDGRATATLQHFLRAAPNHPAAPMVRNLLAKH